MTTEYVPIEDRVRVMPHKFRPSDSELQLLVHRDQMVRFYSSPCAGLIEREAGDIRNAIRLACEAVRERCAEAVELRMDECPICGDSSCSRCRALKYANQAIRGLEL